MEGGSTERSEQPPGAVLAASVKAGRLIRVRITEWVRTVLHDPEIQLGGCVDIKIRHDSTQCDAVILYGGTDGHLREGLNGFHDSVNVFVQLNDFTQGVLLTDFIPKLAVVENPLCQGFVVEAHGYLRQLPRKKHYITNTPENQHLRTKTPAFYRYKNSIKPVICHYFAILVKCYCLRDGCRIGGPKLLLSKFHWVGLNQGGRVLSGVTELGEGIE